MSTRDEVIQQAMALPPEDRAYIADLLERSLNGGEFATPELAAAWAEEAERRVAAYDRGELGTANAETALDRVRQRLADHHTRKA